MGEVVHLEEEKTLLGQLLEHTEAFEHHHANELAKILRHLYYEEDPETFLEYILQIPEEYLGDILLELPENLKDEALLSLSVPKLVDVVDEMDSDDATDLMQDIEGIDEAKEQEILSGLDEENVEEIERLKTYRDDEAGSIMQTELFSAQLDEPIAEAIERLKTLKRDQGLDNVHQVFIVDDFDFLIGAFSLEEVITFSFDTPFRDYLDEHHKRIQSVRTTTPIEEVIHLFEDYNLVVLPVVDSAGKLVGRITSDDIYDIIEGRATEQMYKMAGVDEEAEEDKAIGIITRKRAVWLGVNLITAILASLVIGWFDETIQAYVALAVLMPIVASMGGNAGTQSLTVMVRQIALGEMHWSEAKGAIRQEVIVSLLNGVLFAVVMGVVALLWFHDPRLGIVIGLAMVINLLFAGFFGAMIPLVLKQVGIDPAVASSVLLTTVTDVVGFFAFLGLAKLILL